MVKVVCLLLCCSYSCVWGIMGELLQGVSADMQWPVHVPSCGLAIGPRQDCDGGQFFFWKVCQQSKAW